MTNEELAAIKPEDTQFFKTAARLFTEFFIDLKEDELRRFLDTPLGKYLWKVNDIITDIDQNLDDIKLSEKHIADFEPGIRPLKTDKNAAHLIRYHYENYLLRTVKLKDLSLTLINKVMRLELRTGTNLENNLLKRVDPKYGDFIVIWSYMKQLTDYVKPYRNHLAHNGSVKHKGLALLDAHYTHGLKHKHKSIVDEFRYEAAMAGVRSELIENFTAQTKAYLTTSNQVLTMIYLYLARPFIDNVDVLVKQHSQT